MTVLIPGINEIGSGVNVVTGNLSSSHIFKHSLFDWSDEPLETIQIGDKTYNYPKGFVTVHNASSMYYDVTAGSSLEKYSKSLSSKFEVKGGYAGFSTSLSADFGESYQHNTFYEFSRVQNEISTHILVLNSNMDYLRKHLKNDIKQKIESGDPRELFDGYGSHYGNNLKIGGRIIHAASTNKLTFKRKMNLNALAEVSYKELIKASGGGGTETESYEFRKNSNFNLVAQGGMPGIVSADLNEDSFSRWRESVSNNPVFISFNKEGGPSLSFIGDLASTQKRRDELLEAYVQWARKIMTDIPQDKGPYLEGKMVAAHYSHYDYGSGSDRNIAIYQPNVGDGCDWKFLGQSYREKSQLVVREKPWAKGVLATIPNVDSGITVWAKWSNHYGVQITFWHPQAQNPVDYVTLGSFLKHSHGENIRGLVAVHRDLCKKSTYGENIWDDKGSGVRGDCGVWAIKDSYKVNTFIAADNYNAPNPDLIWVLKEEAVEMLN